MNQSEIHANVCCIIPTYANRFYLIKRVIASLIEQNIGKIIVVDNNSTEQSRIELDQLSQNTCNILTIMRLSENTGSANAYKLAIKEALGMHQMEFLWLLDDDNLPDRNALERLVDCWNLLDEKAKETYVCLACNRTHASCYEQSVFSEDPELVIGPRNSFWGFHVSKVAEKIREKIQVKGALKLKRDVKYGRVMVMPYGGLFFHKGLIQTIGLPNTDYYLYGDDYEFTSRISKTGGSLYLVLESKITDLQPSWEIRAKSTRLVAVARTANYRSLYYTVRNMVAFQRQCWSTNRFVALINLCVFSICFGLIGLVMFRFKSLFIYCLAIGHGLTGRTGRCEIVEATKKICEK